MELLVGGLHEQSEHQAETNFKDSHIRIKEEPPDPESYSHVTTQNVFPLQHEDPASRRSRSSESESREPDAPDIDDAHAQMRAVAHSVTSLLKSSSSNNNHNTHSGQFDNHWHKVGSAPDTRSNLTASSTIAARPITLMDLKSSANIPTVKPQRASTSQGTTAHPLQCPVCEKVWMLSLSLNVAEKSKVS